MQALKLNRSRHRRREGPAMQRRNARRFGHIGRLNFIDGWQVFGTIGLVVGALTFGILIANGRHVLPATGSAVRLVLQTLTSESPHAHPVVEPTPSPTASPAPTAPAPAPSAPRVPVRVVAPRRSQPPAPTQSVSPTPVPIPTATPTD